MHSPTKSHINTQTFVTILGLVCLGLLMIMAFVYYQERIYFSDPAFQLFLLINDGTVEVMTNRWPSTVFRFLPFIGLHLGIGVGGLAKLFSISFPLYQAICFAIVLFVLKNRELALLMLFCLLLGTTESFYWCSSDLLQGIMTSLIAIAVYKKYDNLWVTRAAISIPFILSTVFFHPLTLFPFFFIIIDDILENKRLQWQDAFLPISFGALWIMRSKLFATWYDNAKSAEFWGNFEQYLLMDIPTHQVFFWQEIPLFYQLVFLVGVVSLFILVKHKFYLRALFMIASVVVMILVVHIANPSSSLHFYREASYIPLVVFVSYPFIKHTLRFDNIDVKYKIFIALILALSFVRILFFASDYTERIEVLQKFIDDAPCDKSVIELDPPTKSILKMDWGVPFETLLLATEQDEVKTIFNTDKPKDYLKRERKDVFLGPFKILYTTEFNLDYFPFKESDYCDINKD